MVVSWNKLFKVIFFIHCCVKFEAVTGQDCTPGFLWGQLLLPGTSRDTLIDESFVNIDDTITCEGVITIWEFTKYPTAPGNRILFQVYRPVGGSYLLIGENEFDSGTSNPDDLYNVPRAFQLPVQNGDLIGWTDIPAFPNADGMLHYIDGLPGSNQYDQVLMKSGSCIVGVDCDWTGATQFVREYDLQVTLDPFVARPPYIDNLYAEISIAENQPAGLDVYHVVGSNNHNYNPVVPPDLTYSITAGGNNDFEIDPVTGVVSTTVELDYESTREYNLTIAIAVDQGPVKTTHILRIFVINVNEPHSMLNLPDVVQRDVNGLDNNDILYTLQHNDHGDMRGNWPEVSYILINPDPAADVFTIQGAQVRPTQDLSNWQGPSVITLYISARDYYFNTAPLTLTVILTNIREAPHLINLPNIVSLPENQPAGSIYTVSAVRDTRAAPLTFSITAVYPAQWTPPNYNPFSISTNGAGNQRYEGIIGYTAIPSFDYMAVRKYEVEIIVSDDMFSSVAENLTVEITWVNHPPYFIEHTYGPTSIPELSPIGTILPDVVLESDDRDIPLGDWTDYVITNNNTNSFHASNLTNRVIVVGELNCPPNVPTVIYDLQVYVHDAAGATDPQPAVVRLEVTDINNHAPVFTATHYEGEVSETSRGGTYILTVEATDDDAGKNAEISFVVIEDYARLYFEAIPTCVSGVCTGELQVKQPISHVDYPSINFTLLAFDHGRPMLNDTATVFVNVIDENNHPPEFVQEYYNEEAKTDLRVGGSAVHVEIYDLDTDINSNVTFVLLIPESTFNIEASSGHVRSKTSLQAYKRHILYAYARDYASPELLSDPCVVRIDTFTPSHHLVDIHMALPLREFLFKIEEFLNKLNKELHPWHAKQDRNLLYPDESILTIYALSEKPSDSLDDLEDDKIFIDRNALLSALRVNIPGKPQDWLRGPNFADFQVFKVLPTYPIWLIDTIGGIVTLVLLCILFIAIWVLLCCVIFRGCHKKNKVSPDLLYSDAEQYELRYGKYTHVPFPKEPNLEKKKKKSILPSPLIASTLPPPKEDVSELPPVKTNPTVDPNKPLPPSGLNRNI